MKRLHMIVKLDLNSKNIFRNHQFFRAYQQQLRELDLNSLYSHIEKLATERKRM